MTRTEWRPHTEFCPDVQRTLPLRLKYTLSTADQARGILGATWTFFDCARRDDLMSRDQDCSRECAIARKAFADIVFDSGERAS